MALYHLLLFYQIAMASAFFLRTTRLSLAVGTFPSRVLRSSKCTYMYTYLPITNSVRWCSRIGYSKIIASTSSNGIVEEFVDNGTNQKNEGQDKHVSSARNIILWRGEGTKGYSLQFRHLEFSNAYMASMSALIPGPSKPRAELHFSDATPIVDELDDLYGAMQYIHAIGDTEGGREANDLCTDAIVKATERTSLVREVYQIVATAESYQKLATAALQSGILSDIMNRCSDSGNFSESKENSHPSWCIRLRQYGPSGGEKGTRYGVSKRSSMQKEREAIMAMRSLLETFVGPVRLKNPDCPLYIFEGLNQNNITENVNDVGDGIVTKILARRIASGPQSSLIAPKTRICITRTPLCPLAAFIMCNLARVGDGDKVLDPYSGSCSTLLAAAMIAPTCTTVGVEVQGEKSVNREEIRKDFALRGLTLPKALIEGDCTIEEVRNKARSAIDGGSFDAIIADPPYGLRERISSSAVVDTSINGNKSVPTVPPLEELIECMGKDRSKGRPLLRKGGRLVSFIPVDEWGVVEDGMPSQSQLDSAGLRLISITEQPLSTTFSRWLGVWISD